MPGESKMAEKPAAISRREIEQNIVALAWKDENFRKAFLADPKRQFEERLGAKLPASLKITAHAEDENHLYFVIPAPPKASSELSDADLEKVAGGVDVVISLTVVGVALVAGVAGSAVGSLAGEQAGWRKA
jgi:hypothetical protein